MSDYTEIELKLQVMNSAIWKHLLASPLLISSSGEPNVVQNFEARYYDTADRVLQKARLAYRIRREGAHWVATVKGDGDAAGGLHRRQEWNVKVNNANPDIEPFMATPVGPRLRQELDGKELVLLCITRFQRQISNLSTLAGSRIEAAADRGEILAPNSKRIEPILEVELELKAGIPADLLKMGAALSRQFPLLPESRSKFYRGLLLAGLISKEDQVSSAPIGLENSDSLNSCLESIMPGLVQNLLAEQMEFIRTPDEFMGWEGMWRSLSRLRAFLAFFQPLFSAEEYMRHDAALQGWGRTIAPLRKLDLLFGEWNGKENKPAAELLRQRCRLSQQLAEYLKSGSTTPFLLDLWAWLLQLPWQKSLQEDVTLEAFVQERLPQWIKE